MIQVNGMLVYTIETKSQWINRFPGDLPDLPKCERFLWIDQNGNVAAIGEDFMVAEDISSYPINIYWLQRIGHAQNPEYVQKIKNLFK